MPLPSLRISFLFIKNSTPYIKRSIFRTLTIKPHRHLRDRTHKYVFHGSHTQTIYIYNIQEKIDRKQHRGRSRIARSSNCVIIARNSWIDLNLTIECRMMASSRTIISIITSAIARYIIDRGDLRFSNFTRISHFS